MSKINLHVQIVSSSKTYLSSMSAPSRQAVYDILSKNFTTVGITLVDDLASLKGLVKKQPDIVFLGMKFIPKNPKLGLNDNNKIWLSDFLEERGITCTGSPSEAHHLEVNKDLAKDRVRQSGLSTSKFFTVKYKDPSWPIDMDLSYPMFVKPTNRGGGLGIDQASVVYDKAQLTSKVSSIHHDCQSDALIERYLPGREFSVAILRQPHDMRYIAMPIELVVEADYRGVTMLAGDVKSSNSEQVLKVEDQGLKSAVSNLAIDAFKSLGSRDYGRIDIRLDENGRPAFLEANLIPSLIAGYGSFPKSCSLNMNLAHETIILTLVNLAIMRSESVLDQLHNQPAVGLASMSSGLSS